MKRIPLTKGQYALVDEEDYEWLSQWKWLAVRVNNQYYAARSAWNGKGYKRIYMHRQIMKDPAKLFVDHINHIGLDNQKHNLRTCNRSQNNMNSRKPDRFAFSKFKSITRNRSGTWRARIFVKGKRLTIGTFPNENLAALAYDLWANFFFGDFAQLNFTKAISHSHQLKSL